jgi:aldose 1-epimerase
MDINSFKGEEIAVYKDRPVLRFTIKNHHGLEVHVLNFGGIITKILAPDRQGTRRNVVFGFDHFEDYLPNLDHHLGCLVGRYANRIGGAAFTINGTHYQLTANENNNMLHGGKDNFSKRFWEVEQREENRIKLSIKSPDADNGFPGNLQLDVDMTVTDENELIFDYTASSDKDTYAGFTQHSYFNLSGASRDVLSHFLSVNADFITETDQQLIPTGVLKDLSNTAFDLRMPKRIEEIIQQIPEGLDDNFVLNEFDEKNFSLNKAAELYDANSGRLMEVFTTEPGLQIYTANHLHKIEGDFLVPKFPAICMEAQHFPDSPNKPEFPSTLLRKGETYRQKTVYRFSVKGSGV